MKWYKTSLGKKYIMGITGFLLIVFVFGHMMGNLSVLGGADGINAYGQHLRAFPPLLWAFRGVMLVAFVLHIATGIQLYLENKAARPVAYAQKKNLITTFSAMSMPWTGLLLLAFAVYHLLHFTLHAFNPEFGGMIDAAGRPDVFGMVAQGFSKFGTVVVYVAASAMVLLHLRHGAHSFFQSLGLASDRSLPKLKKGGKIFAGLVFAGFLVSPVLVFLGVLNP